MRRASSSARASIALAGVAALGMGRGVVTSGRMIAAHEDNRLTWRRIKTADYTPDQDRKPRGVNRAAKRQARAKAVAWKGNKRRAYR